MTTENPERSDLRDPAEIERDIAQTREAIDSTVDELGQRLAPSQLMDDARSYVKESAMRGANSLWNTMSDNAIPLLMVGGVLVWMMSARRASAYASGNGSYGSGSYGSESEAGGTDWEPAESTRRGMARRTTERAREVGGRVLETGADVKSRAQEQLQRAQHGLQSMGQEQPLMLGLAALALGGLVGGLLPSTRREDELVGEMRDELVGAAVQAGREKVEGVREAAEGIAHAAAGQGSQQQAGEPDPSQAPGSQSEGEEQRESAGRSGGRSGGRASRPSPSPRI